MAKNQSPKGFQWLNHLLAVCLLASCIVVPPPAAQSPQITLQTQVMGQEMSYAEQMRQKALVMAEKIKNKKTYNGPIGVHLNSGLLSSFSSQSAKVLDLTEQLNQDSALFEIQSLPTGPIIFQKTYEIGHHKLKELQTFRVSNTNQRYTLVLENPNVLNGELEVNINGTDWINAGDTKGQSYEVKREGLLLNSQNALRVLANGKKGTHFTVSIIEGGEAGTLLRRRHLGREENQASRLRHNDTNIFNPFAPDSLGDLDAYNGEEIIDEGFKKTGLKVNGTDQLDFQSGTLILNFNQPEHKAAFEAEYGATVLAQNGDYYLMQLDLSKSPIEKIASLLKLYNMGLEEDIRDISFASLAGMQTFTILLDSLIYHMEWFKGIEVNGVMKNTQTAPVATPTPLPTATHVCDGKAPTPDWVNYNCTTDLADPKKGPGKSWWLTDTKVAENPGGNAAWDYSIGTGVKVAFIDRGFKTSHAEVSRRIKVSAAYGNDDDINQANPVSAYHGHKSITTGFAEKGNEQKTAGSAPNADIYPYRAPVDYWAFQTAIDNARYSGVDIIGMSSVGKDFIWVNWITIPISILFGGLYHLVIPIFNWSGAGMMKAIDAAVEQKIVFVTSAGNDGKNFKDFIPSNHPKVITVAALWPRSAREIDAATGLALSGKEGLRVADFSNWGDGVIWAPGGKIDVSDPNGTKPPFTFEYEGTSAASPFVTGVVALIKSRNPALSPAQIKQILKEASLKGITADKPDNLDTRFSKSQFPDSMAPVRMLDVSAALQHALVNTASRKAETFFGLVEDGKVLKLNKSVQGGSTPVPANEEKSKTLLETIGETVWKTNLAAGNLVQVKGWSDIKAGYRQIAKNEIEILDGNALCAANNCITYPPEFNPQLTQGEVTADGTTAYILSLKGENLIADLRNGIALPITLAFAEQPSGTVTELKFASADIISINNEASELKVRLLRTRITATPNPAIPGGTLKPGTGKFNIAFKNTILNKTSNFIGNGTGNFAIASTGGGGQAFALTDLSQVTPYQLPTGIEVYLKQGSREVEVQPDEVIGFAVKENIDLSQLEVEVAGQTFNVQQILHDASSGFKYGSFKLPSHLPPGVQDVIIRLAGTPGVTLEQALKVLLPSRVNIRMSRNILFSDGSEKAEVYITVRDAQGQIVPDGSRFFIRGLYPEGNPSYYLYDYLSQTDSCIGYYCGPPGQVFEVRNGRIHFKLGVGFYINPLLIVDPWPTINSPSFQLKVCTPAYSSFQGYYCLQEIGPSEVGAGRFFMHHIDAINVISKTPVPGGVRIEMAVKDVLGNPIPVGHVLTFENGGYSQCLIRQDGTAESGYTRIPVTEPGKIVVKWNSDDIACNRSAYFNVLQGNRAGYYLKGSPVLLP